MATTHKGGFAPASADTPRSQLRQRSLVIAAVMLTSGSAALLSSRIEIGLALLVPLASFFTFAIFRWPPLGLAAVIAGALILPFELNTGTQTTLNLAMLLLPVLMILWILRSAAKRSLRLPSSKVTWPLLILLGSALLAFVYGQLVWYPQAQHAPLPAQLGGLAIFILSAVAFLLMALQVKTVLWLERLTWLFLAMAGAFVASRIVPGLGGLTSFLVRGGATGSLIWTWFTGLAFAQVMCNRQLDRRWRVLILALVAGLFFVNVFQGQRWASGWIPPLVAATVVLWLTIPRIALIASLGGTLLLLVDFHALAGFVMVGDNPYSLTTRLEAWRIIGEITQANPLLGLGPANYYWYASISPILGYSVPFSSHNQYVDLYAQTGIVGLLAFLWFILALWVLGWRLRQEVSDGFPKAYVVGALGAIAGTLAAGMLGDWVLPFVYNVGLRGFRSSVIGWMFMGGLVALGRLVRQSQFGDRATQKA